MSTTTMTGFIQAILDTLAAASWPVAVAQINFHEPPPSDDPAAWVTGLTPPALLLHITERRSAADEAKPFKGPGRVSRRCWFELHCILSTSTPDVAMTLVEFSEAALALIDAREHPTRRETGNRWGLGAAVERPEQLADTESLYAVAWPGLAVRLLTWEQVVYLPDS